MRCLSLTAFAAALLLSTPGASMAQDRGSADFFSGLSLNQLSSVSSSPSSAINFSGRVAVNLVPGLQAVGEVGRIGNVLPSLTDALFSFSPFDVRASAIYGEGGVRAFASPRSAVNPYVEATAGMARLNLKVGGFGATESDLIDLGLAFVDRTSPLAGIGGGVMFHRGPLVVDLGYRYKKIFAQGFVERLLAAGDSLQSHQVSVGVGVRF